jgi:hypothetical protein
VTRQSRQNGKTMSRWVMMTLMMLAGAAAHATDEEPVCRFLLQQIGFATQRASSAHDDALRLKRRNTLNESHSWSEARFKTAYLN